MATKTLRVTLADILGPAGPSGRVHGEVWAVFVDGDGNPRQIRKTDGTVIVPAKPRQSLDSAGVVDFVIVPNDDATVHVDDRGFGVKVGWDLTVRGEHGAKVPVKNTGTIVQIVSSDDATVQFGLKAPYVPIIPGTTYLTQGTGDARYEPTLSNLRAIGGDETSRVNTFLASASPLGVKRLIGSFSVSGLLTIPANANVDATGATVTQTTAATTTVLVNSGARVTGLAIVGKGTDYVASSAVYASVGFALATNATNVTIQNCKVTNMAGAGVYASTPPTGLKVIGCDLTGLGSGVVPAGGQWSAGVSINNDGAVDVLVANTSIAGFAQGIGTGNITDLRVANCYIKDIVGQHGIYVASASRYAITGNIIDNANLEGVKVQIGSTGSPDATEGIISGNVISRCGSHGIHLTNTAGGAPRHRRVAITGNTISTDAGSTGDGISLDSTDDATIVGNRISGGRNGINATNCAALTIATNRTSACTDRGIFISNTTDFDLLHNRVKDVATANGASTEFGIQLDGATTADGRMVGNKVTDSGGNMRYAMNCSGLTAANQATVSFVDNILTGATDYGARFVAGTTQRFHGNVLQGTTGPVLTAPTNYAANADTTGATLAALEIEVNELKATLRAAGILA